ncbi:MAG: DUF3187 family protein, partial [Deltaproteobacteria bacterium]|nr:DUF3187 family protein [Deltaproteobacteria bacterium]
MRLNRSYRATTPILFFLITLLMPSHGFTEDVDSNYNFGRGAFQYRSQSPGQSLRFTMLDILPGPINAGWRTSTGATWTNTWADNDEYTLDYEMLDAYVAVSYAFNNRFEIGFFFENRSFFGGYMDNTIQEFHDIFGIGQS